MVDTVRFKETACAPAGRYIINSSLSCVTTVDKWKKNVVRVGVCFFVQMCAYENRNPAYIFCYANIRRVSVFNY